MTFYEVYPIGGFRNSINTYNKEKGFWEEI
jgi:hypothetical protein